MKETNFDLNRASKLFKPADVLLFKSKGFPHLSWWISKYTNSIYSHVGLASYENNEWCSVEFKEFIGSRIKPLQEYINSGKQIDVYRAVPQFFHLEYYNDSFVENSVCLTISRQNAIVDTAKTLIGRPYGWNAIVKMAKSYTPILRLHSNGKDDIIDPIVFVCSTLVSYSYRKNYVDLVRHLSDDRVSPGDISRSAILRYVFSIGNTNGTT